MLRSGLFWKLYLGYGILILITATVVGFLIGFRLQKDSLAETEALLVNRATLLREIAGPDKEKWGSPAFRERLTALGKETSTRFTVIDANGVVAADSEENPALMDNHSNRPEIVQARIEGTGAATRYSTTLKNPAMYVALPITGDAGGITGYVRVAIPLTALDDRLAHLRNIVIMGALIAAVLALILGYEAARFVTRPLVSLNEVVRAIAAGDHSRRIRVHGSDEIGQLAMSVNMMADQLADRLSAIARERNRLLAILSGMVEGVIAVDQEDKVVHINQAAGRLLNIDPSGSVGKKIWEATRIREVSDTILRAKKEGRQINYSLKQPAGYGDTTVEMYASPMLDEKGGIAGAVMLLHDVTELKRLESVRRDFASNAAHELKTPLAAIRGMVETILGDESMDPEQHRKFLSKIGNQTIRLSSIVADLLTLSSIESRTETFRREPVDLCQAAKDSLKAFAPAAEAKKLKIESEIPDSPVMVLGDMEALQQIIGNLLDNAIKYTPSDGHVSLRIAVEKDKALVEVQDTGIGIEPKEQERIFERFYRVDKGRSREMGGTGLGLAIVKHLTLALEGDVSVESFPGKGSTFRVSLPLRGTNSTI
jgi:two-component system phosphate regulon sensor histidine kinase PhoR